MSEPIRLNIGAGDTTIPGFIPIDAKLGHRADKLDYASETVDEIYASHVLEHIHFSQHVIVMKEWARVLKPGGRIRVAVPNFDMVIQQYLSEEISPDKFNAWIHGGLLEDTDRHKIATFNPERLELLLRRCGFEDVVEFEPEYEDCTLLPESINFEAKKRQFVIKENPKVTMVMSRPRVGFMDCAARVIETARVLGWPYVDAEGTEWGRGLTAAVEAAIASTECDYLCFLDYDGVFTPDDCKEMLRLMQENPEVGALFPVQMHRHRNGILGSMDGEDYSGDMTPVTTGHFGCTLIRREVFESLPQPWFMSLPNPVTGRWLGGGSTLDADIYFWTMMWDHGYKVCMANKVMIGHMELCVKWGTKGGEYWQTLRDYRDNGRPKCAEFDGAFWKEAFKPRTKIVPTYTNGVSGKEPEQCLAQTQP